MSKVPVAVLNADTGFDFTNYMDKKDKILALTKNHTLGETVSYFLFSPDSPASSLLDWQPISPFITLDDLNTRLDHGDYWGYVYIPQNFSQTLLLNTVNSTSHLSPNSNGSMSVMFGYDQARQQTVTALLAKLVVGTFTAISQGLANEFIAFAEKSPNGYNDLLVSPKILDSFVTVYINNIHPINVYGQNFSTYITGVVLWIGCLIITSVTFKYFEMGFNNIKKSYNDAGFILRYQFYCNIFPFFLTFVASGSVFLIITILNRGTDFPGNHEPIYIFLFIWLSTIAYLQINCFTATLVGYNNFGMIMSLFLILQLATSAAILDPIVMNSITDITFALPMHHSVKGLRCLMMGSQCNYMGRDVGVLFAWAIGLWLIINMLLYRQILGRLEKSK
ncbi:hypothetical protein HK103_001326 [Boothiomyces macroporosus]|uniref:DUF3533 domain-containing protein n=1 Tax=Boothiomyces macroporosus TaxID=261099 RepID=A0AAD5UEE1_9FUNG|nr:hypothetical protein HK103_001326 [Boothiomyces macroporosus]